MAKDFENVDSLYSSIIALLSSGHKRSRCGYEKRMKNFALGVEHQEQLFRTLDTASDAVQENLDKMRFECKNLQYECETFLKQVEESEERHRKVLAESSQRDIERENRLAQIRAELRMYENILQIGIEDVVNGEIRGVIFKSKGLAYCDLEGVDGSEEDKESTNVSLHQYSRLNSLYSQLEVSDQWKPFVQSFR
ncbi:hypothetical protein ECG_00861 [Echinococcus granulosus]|nr:hypothetical protein ECG_00861 [Echinococcus granulosus]